MSGGNTFIGAFTPVNESVWEHLKLLLFPTLLFSVAEYFVYGREVGNFFAVRIYAVLIGMASIVLLYYTYSGILGQHFLAADIAIFVISAAITYLLSCKLMKNGQLLASNNSSIIAICIIAAVIIFFIYFTFNPPMSELFRDPVSEDFGIVMSISNFCIHL